MQRLKSLIRYLFLVTLITLSACGRNNAQPSQVSNPTSISNVTPSSPPACVAFDSQPTPGPETASIFPPVTEADHIRGTEDALITLIDYSDYQDPLSGSYAAAAKQLLSDHPSEIRLISRPFPVFVVNDKSAYAALAAEAAAEQDKYWEMHDLLFEQQANWLNLSVDDFKHWLVVQAASLELDVEKFKTDYAREDVIAKVQKAWDEGTKIQLPGTPVVVLNGDLYQGPKDYTSLNDIVKLIILGKRQFTTCPPVTVDPQKQYIATLKTEKGNVVIELFADKAPMTVNSFIFLAQNGWYDDITFHRVIPSVYAQTGDPSGSGKGNPGYYIITEITPSLTFDKPGMVAMVNSGPDTSGSQFFITYAPTVQYNGMYTIFGQVLKGMDVLLALTPRDAQPGVSTPPGDKLISITIEEK